jgi:hypothetical protein
MNYTIQKRIKEIVKVLDQIINNIKRDPRRVGLDKPNAEKRRKIYQKINKFSNSEIAWESVVLEKTKTLKNKIENEYQLELEELEEKEAVIKDWVKNQMNPEINKVRDYFFDEHFLMALFYSDPRILLELGKLIITDERINWKPTFLKLANELIQSSNCDVESFENFIEVMNSLQYSPSMEGDTVWFLFSPENVDKKDLEQKMKTNYDRYLKIDSYINEGANINQKTELVNDLELVLSSLINSDQGYSNIPDEFKSNELVYLFAAFNSSSTFKNTHEDIQSNEAIVNYAFNIDKLKVHEPFNQIEKRKLQKQHLENIYPYASEEIKANPYIDDLANSEIGGNDENGGINLGDYAII